MDTSGALDRMLWRSAHLIYRANRREASAERAALIAYAWDFLTTEGCALAFKPEIMRPIQVGVTERLVTIANRGRWGMPLVPELA